LLFRLESSLEKLTLERNHLTNQVSSHDAELEKVNAELLAAKDQLLQHSKEKAKSLIKAEELNSKELALDYR